MALIDILVPDIGDFKDVAVIELLVKPGDTVQAEQSLITVESDKASMEIPSSHAGVVKALKVAVGDKVNQGSVVLSLETAGAAASSSSAFEARDLLFKRLRGVSYLFTISLVLHSSLKFGQLSVQVLRLTQCPM